MRSLAVVIKVTIIVVLISLKSAVGSAEIYKITAYCACKKCCGEQAQGLTASGKKVKVGMVACNHLAFGTKVKVSGLGKYVVEDRGSKKYFGTRANKVRHLDVYMVDHHEALHFGVKFLDVVVVNK
jgi:3D (Asp-Asp-Asp) domain-containing protein